MNLTKSIFWDVDYNTMDQEEHDAFIITRVLMRGTWNDWSEIKLIYGLVRIKEIALNARYLDELTLSFCSAYFDIPKDKFRCYIMKQLNQGLWML